MFVQKDSECTYSLQVNNWQKDRDYVSQMFAFQYWFYFWNNRRSASGLVLVFFSIFPAPSAGPPQDFCLDPFFLPTVRSSPSKMEDLGGYPAKSSNPKAKKLTVLLSMTVCVGCLFLLQTQLAKPRKPKDFYSFEVKDAKGRTVSLEKYRGKVCPHHHQSYQFDKKSVQTLFQLYTVS